MYEIDLDFVKLANEFAGRWVALHPATYEVIAAGFSPEEVLEKARQADIEEPIITHVLDDYGSSAACLASAP